ncbi:MAG: hypothetical protein ACI4QI_01240 [Candidatus Coproplasma sp.]
MAQSNISSLEGNELEEGYVRTHAPKGNRWGDTWNILKNNFVQLVIINVLTLLFFVPGIAVVYFRLAYISQMGLVYPFSNNALGIYPITPSMTGSAEGITLSADLMFISLLVVAGIIASIGISGACYSIKKILNTNGVFHVKDYFKGIKVDFFNVVFPIMVFMICLFGSFCVSDWAAWQIALGAPKAGPIIAQVCMIVVNVLVGIYMMWVIAVGVSYRVKLKYLLKNSFILLIGTIIQSIFMIGFSLIPAWFLWIGVTSQFFLVLGCIIFIFIGFSFIILCWLAYTQWVFDMYITPAIKSEEEARKATLTPKQLAAEKLAEEKAQAREILAAGRSELVGRPLRPIEGGTEVEEVGIAYGRKDVARVAADRAKISGEINAYYEEHKGEAKYVEYEKMFAEREKALNSGDKKKGKKKVSRNNLLGN